MAPPAPSPALGAFLESVLPQTERTALRTSLLPALLQSISAVSASLRTSHHVALAGTANTFGDDQLNVDVAAENLIRAALAECPSVATASSEEDPVEVSVNPQPQEEGREVYTIAFDPLDGSSIIAPNWTVGTIVGIWDGASALDQPPREKQIAAILGVLGPRTTAIVALRIPGTASSHCFEVSLDHDTGGIATSQIVRPEVRLTEPGKSKTRYFAPANLRAAANTPRYMDLIQYYISSKYTLRYCGGLVPDIVHALTKGHGVYVSPVTASTGAPKLRRLFELLPVALVIECAGGAAVDPGDGVAVLDRALSGTDERGGLVCGNVEEVEKVKEMLVG